MHITLLVTDIDTTSIKHGTSSVEVALLGRPVASDGWRPQTGGILLVGDASEQVKLVQALAKALGFHLAADRPGAEVAA